MAQIHGVIERKKYVWAGQGWAENPADAIELPIPEAHRQLRILNANNRFLDPEDQVEAEVVESRE